MCIYIYFNSQCVLLEFYIIVLIQQAHKRLRKLSLCSTYGPLFFPLYLSRNVSHHGLLIIMLIAYIFV